MQSYQKLSAKALSILLCPLQQCICANLDFPFYFNVSVRIWIFLSTSFEDQVSNPGLGTWFSLSQITKNWLISKVVWPQMLCIWKLKCAVQI